MKITVAVNTSFWKWIYHNSNSRYFNYEVKIFRFPSLYMFNKHLLQKGKITFTIVIFNQFKDINLYEFDISYFPVYNNFMSICSFVQIKSSIKITVAVRLLCDAQIDRKHVLSFWKFNLEIQILQINLFLISFSEEMRHDNHDNLDELFMYIALRIS